MPARRSTIAPSSWPSADRWPALTGEGLGAPHAARTATRVSPPATEGARITGITGARCRRGWQTPPTHEPPRQSCPQAPQLVLSVCVSSQKLTPTCAFPLCRSVNLTVTGGVKTTVAVTGASLIQLGTVAGVTALQAEPNASALNVTDPSASPFNGTSVLAPAATCTLFVTVWAPLRSLECTCRREERSRSPGRRCRYSHRLRREPGRSCRCSRRPTRSASRAVAAPSQCHGGTRVMIRVDAFLIG